MRAVMDENEVQRGSDERQKRREQSSRIGSELFKKKVNGDISMEDFTREMAYWTLMNVFDTVKYIPLPEVPEEMNEYWRLDDKDKSEISKELFAKPHIGKYLDGRYEAITKNTERIKWLQELHDNIPANDTKNRERVIERKNEIQRRFNAEMETLKIV